MDAYDADSLGLNAVARSRVALSLTIHQPSALKPTNRSSQEAGREAMEALQAAESGSAL
jgi:hypothetical protein